MGGWVTIGHACFPCPTGRTLLFLSDLFLVGSVVGWQKWEVSKLGRWKKGEEGGVSWEGGKGRRVVRCKVEKMGG